MATVGLGFFAILNCSVFFLTAPALGGGGGFEEEAVATTSTGLGRGIVLSRFDMAMARLFPGAHGILLCALDSGGSPIAPARRSLSSFGRLGVSHLPDHLSVHVMPAPCGSCWRRGSGYRRRRNRRGWCDSRGRWRGYAHPYLTIARLMALHHPVEYCSRSSESRSRSARDMGTLLCSNVALIDVPALGAKPRDGPWLLSRWRANPPRTASVHQTLDRHLAHASRGSHSRTGQNACRTALNAHLSTKTRASEKSGDRSTPHGMPCGTTRRVGEGMTSRVRHILGRLSGTGGRCDRMTCVAPPIATTGYKRLRLCHRVCHSHTTRGWGWRWGLARWRWWGVGCTPSAARP